MSASFEEPEYFLIFFQKDNTFIVKSVEEVGEKFKKGDTVKIQFGKSWFKGEIKCRGSESKCNRRSVRFQDKQAKLTSEEEGEKENEEGRKL
jgi:hypothetical protein